MILLSALIFFIPQARGEKDAVAIIIDQSVYNEVKKEFDTYAKDVISRFPVELIILKDKAWESANPDEIRAELQKLYKEKNIAGAVLVGQIPYTFWERATDSIFTGINTLYYQELDGRFIDADSDGRYDNIEWGSNAGPELWVFWMRPPKSENVAYLRTFLKKCHDYYEGKLKAPYRALLFAETDYSHMYREMMEPLIELYGTDNIVVGSMPFKSNPREVPTLSALESKGCEILTINTHAFCMVHSNIRTRHINILGYSGVLTMIYGCHTAAFDEAPEFNLTQGYVFRTKYGMASAGTSWGAGIPPWKEMWLYRHLGEGMYLGKAYGLTEKYDYTPELAQSKYGIDPKNFENNMSINMMGNPFVYLAQKKPSGSTYKNALFLYRLIDPYNIKYDRDAKHALALFVKENNAKTTSAPLEFKEEQNESPLLADKGLITKYAKSLGVNTLLFNELDYEAKKIIDKELSRLWSDFEKVKKAGDAKKAELIAETMALLGKCALNGRGGSSVRGKIRKFLEKEKYDDTYKYIAALYGNLAVVKDRDFLIRLLNKIKGDAQKQKAIAQALGHCCSPAELDWLLDFIKKSEPEIASAAGTYLDEIVSESDFPKVKFLLESNNPALRREYYSIASKYQKFDEYIDYILKNNDMLPADVALDMVRFGYKHDGLAEACKRTVFGLEEDVAQNMSLWLYSTLPVDDGPEIMKRALTECKTRGVRRRALIEIRRWKDKVDYKELLPYIEEKDLWICLTAIETIEEIAGKPIEQITGKIKRDYAETCTEY